MVPTELCDVIATRGGKGKGAETPRPHPHHRAQSTPVRLHFNFESVHKSTLFFSEVTTTSPKFYLQQVFIRRFVRNSSRSTIKILVDELVDIESMSHRQIISDWARNLLAPSHHPSTRTSPSRSPSPDTELHSNAMP